MTRELLDLWITRLVGLAEPVVADENPGADALATPGGHLVITTGKADLSGRYARHALRRRALLDGQIHAGQINPEARRVEGWLAVDVPVPRSADPAHLAHRMIRRLYFTAVLHGLGERRELREAVQGMRRSYLQTRGKVTTSEGEKSTRKGGAELGVTFDLLKPLTGKLTAASELEIAESLVAEMQRLDLFEAEDQLLFDLQLLAQLNAHVDRFAEVRDPTVPRWETVRAFFKSVYGRIAPKTTLGLRPVFVFDAWGLGEATALFAFFAQASGLKVAGPAQMLVHGGPMLHRLLKADQALGHLVLRPEWQLWSTYRGGAQPADLSPAEKRAVEALRARHPAPVVKALLTHVLAG